MFVGPGAYTANDATMSRHDHSYELRGAILRRACRRGSRARWATRTYWSVGARPDAAFERRPASVQMIWSRPGPTPMSEIGTPTKSET